MSFLEAYIDIYARLQYHGHLEKVCVGPLAKGRDVFALFWQTHAQALQGKHEAASKVFSSLVEQKDFALAATAALINTQKLAGTEVDAKLKAQLKEFSKVTEGDGLLIAARYFWLSGNRKQARQCVEKVLSVKKTDIEALTLFGWANLQSGNEYHQKQSLALFDSAVSLSVAGSGSSSGSSEDAPTSPLSPTTLSTTTNLTAKPHIGALLGRAAYHEKLWKYNLVLHDLNSVLLHHPEFLPAYEEKARILLSMGNWDEAIECCKLVLKQDPKSIRALQILVTHFLSREHKLSEAKPRLTDLYQAMLETEPNNPQLYFTVSQLIARLSNRRKQVLQKSVSMLEKSQELDSKNSFYISEHAYQVSLLGDYDQAANLYEEASKLNVGNMQAVQGRIYCKLMMGKTSEASQELDFLNIQTTLVHDAPLSYLAALLAWQRDNDATKCISFLNRATDEHMKKVDQMGPGFDYIITFNPDFVLNICKEYSKRLGTEPVHPHDPPLEVLRKSIQLLNQLTTLVPGLLEGLFLLAKAEYVSGHLETARKAIVECLRLDPEHAESHLVRAQIAVGGKDYKQAATSLEQARNSDIEVRQLPVYSLIKAKLFEASGQKEASVRQLKTATHLPGVRTVSPLHPWPVQQRLAIFIELAEMHSKLNELKAAHKVLDEAEEEFGKTSEAGRLTIAQADLFILEDDYPRAINVLKTVTKPSPYFTRARTKLANTILKSTGNKVDYATAFHELVEQDPSVHNTIVLGEALLKTGRPNEAIKVLEEALKTYPKSEVLYRQIGLAIQTTHEYDRALKYYETTAQKEPWAVFLLFELATLHKNLKHYEEAIKVLTNILKQNEEKEKEGASALNSSFVRVDTHMLIADVHQASGNVDGVREALLAAWEVQQTVLSKLQELQQNPTARKDQREVAAGLCLRIAEYYKAKDSKNAQRFFQEALNLNPVHIKARLGLGRLALSRDDLDEAQRHCSQLLRIDQNHKEGSMLLAEVMARQNKHDFQFQQLLEKNPAEFDTLAKLIELLKRTGRLREVPIFLKKAENVDAKVSFAAGYHYCKGLYYRYTANPRKALTEFNHSRRDGEWGKRTLWNMIEIYLNPESQLLLEFEEKKSEAKDELQTKDHVAAAEKLLAELATFPNEGDSHYRYVVLESYAAISTKDKTKIDGALKNLLPLVMEDPDYIPALLARVQAFLYSGQRDKAKSELKLIAKMPLNSEYASDFERSWLLLADMYIKPKKQERHINLGKDLCKKALATNKSSAKAWFLLGQVLEFENNFREASNAFERAWTYTNKADPDVALKLATNYVKAKRYVEAVDVCHKISKDNPDFANKVKEVKEILAKARASFRP